MSGSGIARAGNAIVTNAAARGQVLNGIAKAGSVLWSAAPPVPGPVSSYIASNVTAAMGSNTTQAFSLTVNEANTVIIVWVSANNNTTGVTGGGLAFAQRAPAAAAPFAMYWAYAASSFGTATFTASSVAGLPATGVIAFALRGIANPASPFDIAAAAVGTGNLTITTTSPRTLVIGGRTAPAANPPAPPAPFVSAASAGTAYNGAWQRDANTVLTAAGPITMPSGGGSNILDALRLP